MTADDPRPAGEALTDDEFRSFAAAINEARGRELIPLDARPAASGGAIDGERECPDCGRSNHGGQWCQVEGRAPVASQADGEQSIDLTPGVVWTESQLAVVRDLTARAFKAEAKVQRVERLFGCDPDTPCRTTWRSDESNPECSAASIECVEVPMDELRRALDGSPSDDGDD